MTRVHLDTDIGDDIDDAFCLALLLASPELSLQSISTVFLYTDKRADLAREMCNAAGRDVAIVPGNRGAMMNTGVSRWATRKLHHLPTQSFDHPSAEASLLPTLAAARKSCDAILTVGPMTNLAATLVMDPDISRFPRVLSMAAEFQRGGHIEWNILVDPEAAALCFKSGIQIDVIPWSIGPATKLQPADVERLRQAKSPVAKLLVRWLEEFWTHVPNKTNMYDPMTVVALLRPDLFDWHRGFLSVELRGEHTRSATTFRRDDTGPHRVALGVKGDEAREFLVGRICGMG
jgi:purine nucleosidase